MVLASQSAPLSDLRRAVAEIEGSNLSLLEGGQALPLGVGAIDAALGGGLAFAALHELTPSAPLHLGAATAFALTLAARSDRSKNVLWIQPDFAGHEAGGLYGPGLALLGLPLERLLILRVARAVDALWAMEEALKCRAPAVVIAELTEDGAAADLTATRRLTLAARDGGGLGLLLRHRPSPLPSAAVTRWEISAAASLPDAFGGLGRASFDLSLVKNRRGPVGRWIVTWDQHECTSATLSFGVAQAAVNRPDRALLTRAG
jgi:protein ImuA